MSERIAVARAINGIGINGLEYLVHEDDSVLLFESDEKARAHLTYYGFGEQLDDFTYVNESDLKEVST